MKKTLRNLGLILLGSVLFVSCSNENDFESTPETLTTRTAAVNNATAPELLGTWMFKTTSSDGNDSYIFIEFKEGQKVSEYMMGGGLYSYSPTWINFNYRDITYSVEDSLIKVKGEVLDWSYSYQRIDDELIIDHHLKDGSIETYRYTKFENPLLGKWVAKNTGSTSPAAGHFVLFTENGGSEYIISQEFDFTTLQQLKTVGVSTYNVFNAEYKVSPVAYTSVLNNGYNESFKDSYKFEGNSLVINNVKFTKAPEETTRLVGKWYNRVEKTSIEFTKNNEYIIRAGRRGNELYRNVYVPVPGNRYFEVAENSALNKNYKVRGNTLTITEPTSGLVKKYTRIR